MRGAIETLAGGRDPAAVGAEIAQLAKSYDVERILVGLPRHMDGREGEGAAAARELAAACASATGLPVILWDERLSTKGAERLLIEADLSRAHRRRIIDRQAAQWILQSYLDQRRGPAS
ncbi:Resolvase, holliday junction-type, YqgF-like protein [mine drainage metagenome]|uniref:Resolvase, holliday junction-type, YqgF-like protein n=1 Tax=mine drainage metagenome TaxID=410659 RepID=T0ZY61_9ZZZZ